MKQVKADGIPVHCAHHELRDPATLVENPRNPNRHPEAQLDLLARIIKGQGWRAPITVSARSGYIVRGHGRLQAALQLGVKEVPVDVQNYATEAEEWADLVADNRIAELAEIDYIAMREILEELDTGELDMDLTGYSEQALADLLADVGEYDPFNGAGADEVDGVDLEGVVPEEGAYLIVTFADDDELEAARRFFGADDGARRVDGTMLIARLGEWSD